MKRLGLSWTSCALPSCYVKFDVTSKVRDQFGLSDLKRVSPLLPPLCAFEGLPTQYNTIPIQTLCVRSRPVFSYLPVSVFVLG